MRQLVLSDDYVVVMKPHHQFEGIQAVNLPVYLVFWKWVKHPVLMTKKEYEIEYSWQRAEPMCKMDEDFSNLELLRYYYGPSIYNRFYEKARGFRLIQDMPHLERIAVEAVIQNVNIDKVLSFCNSLKEDYRMYFIMVYNKAVLDEKQYIYEQGYHDGLEDGEELTF